MYLFLKLHFDMCFYYKIIYACHKVFKYMRVFKVKGKGSPPYLHTIPLPTNNKFSTCQFLSIYKHANICTYNGCHFFKLTILYKLFHRYF